MAIRPFGEWIPEVNEEAFVAPNAEVMGQVVLEAQSSIWYGCVLRGDIEPIHVGAMSNVQDLSMIHTGYGAPTWIGQGVTVGHQACVHGARIEDYCLIGMGATILDGAVVGSESIIGAGALVPEGKIVPPGVLAVGVPFKIVRALTEEEKRNLHEHAKKYVELARRHREQVREG